jgi:hypothetical protein
MNDVIGSVRQTLQDFLAPELRQHRAELVSIRSEIGSVRSALTTRIEAAENRLDSKIDAVESRLDSKVDVLRSEVRSGFTALGAALENAVLRGGYPPPAKSRTCVSALRGWKKSAGSCLNS